MSGTAHTMTTSTTDEIPAQPFSVPSTYSPLYDVSFVIMVAMLAAVILIGFWSGGSRIWRMMHHISKGASARDLFLGMRFRDRADEQFGYLRSLNLREAEFVTGKSLARGTQVSVVLNSLPGFPDAPDQTLLDATVLNSRPFGTGSGNYLIQVRFHQLSEGVRKPLLTYLEGLAHPQRAYS